MESKGQITLSTKNIISYDTDKKHKIITIQLPMELNVLDESEKTKLLVWIEDVIDEILYL